MNKQDIRNEGFRHGWNVASWTDLPEIGQRIPPDLDWAGVPQRLIVEGETVDAGNRGTVWEAIAISKADHETPVQYLDGSIIKPYDVTGAFQSGAEAGIRAYWRKHYAPKRRA